MSELYYFELLALLGQVLATIKRSDPAGILSLKIDSRDDYQRAMIEIYQLITEGGKMAEIVCYPDGYHKIKLLDKKVYFAWVNFRGQPRRLNKIFYKAQAANDYGLRVAARVNRFVAYCESLKPRPVNALVGQGVVIKPVIRGPNV